MAKEKSALRLAMEESARYLAQAEIGRGLNARQAEACFQTVSRWKRFFVMYMAKKPNLQARPDKNGKQPLLGRRGAISLADNLFRIVYDAEVRALSEPAISPYWTREPGPIEFGRSLAEDEFLPRQFAEVPTGPEYKPEEDEHATNWLLSEENEEKELVESETGFHEDVDFQERNLKYSELLSEMIKAAKANKSLRPILLHAEQLAKADVIAEWQLNKLRGRASHYSEYKQQKRVDNMVNHLFGE